MNAPEFTSRARAHLLVLVSWFALFLALGVGGVGIAEWSERFHGWQATVVYFVFFFVGALASTMALFLGGAIYGWLRLYPVALANLASSASDPEWFMKAYRDVLGPIPWR